VLVPDLFWRQEPASSSTIKIRRREKGLDLYYDFDYDLGVRDMEDTAKFLGSMKECNGKVGSVGYCLGGSSATSYAAAPTSTAPWPITVRI